ncbi:hypothetical protein [Halorussus aquaticus]|uniref:Uncharacterized protein n=1 Tax=Halorussus aquaticus TaxID=2953748 RepID=A0ABD5Q301_9EURY|nr:hypothetical protein [Halorussus aquaticus]
MTQDCRHRGAEVVYTELKGREKQVVAHCEDCNQLLTAHIDFEGEWATIETEPDPTKDDSC